MPAVQPRSQWDITVAAWIIQDGNYDDFLRRQIAHFSLSHSSSVVASPPFAYVAMSRQPL